MQAQSILLGWREVAGLPQLGIRQLRAKIDTGARSSCLHVDAQWLFSEQGVPWVGFRLHTRKRLVESAAPILEWRDVTDSGGHCKRRPFIRTTLHLAGVALPIDINLTDRRGMLFPMLVGRSALHGVFIVDAAASYLHGRRLPPITVSS